YAWCLRKENSLGGRQQEHSDDGKGEHSHGEERRGKPHAWLLKLARSTGKEEDCREEHGVREILARAITRFARLGDTPDRVGPHRCRLRRAADLIEIRHERMRVSRRILEWLLRDANGIGLLYVGRKAPGIEVRELLVAGLLRGEELHEHRGVNDQRLA